MLERAPSRHDLAWLSSAACRDARLTGRACIDAVSARAMLADWVAEGHPLFVTRQPLPAAGLDAIALGLALPPQRGKFRLAFLVDRSAVTRLAAPPTLAAAIGTLPPAWRQKAEALLASPAISAAQPRIYGSAAMQMLSGEPCLAVASDLDLSLSPATWQAAEAALAALATLAGADDPSGPRIDGEIGAPDGGAVAWRELLGQPAKVLVKRLYGVGLEAIADFRAGFAAAERLAT